MDRNDDEYELSKLFRAPDCCLLTVFVLLAILWGLWRLQHSVGGNIGAVLLVFQRLTVLAYIFITPVVGIAYYCRKNFGRASTFREGGAPGPDSPRFFVHLAAWPYIVAFFLPATVGAINGDGPFYVRVREGPDTSYARSGFQELLERPVPDSVERVYYQNRSFIDTHHVLRFNAGNRGFIEGLVDKFRLEEKEIRGEVDSEFAPGEQRTYTERYRARHFTLYYNPKSGDAKLIWFVP